LHEALDSLHSGKEWLESQWRASELERARMQEALTSLHSGKEWLESQWKASEGERTRLHEALDSLHSGKEWLESQWKRQLEELDYRGTYINIQQTEIKSLTSKLTESENRQDVLNEDNERLISNLIKINEKIDRLKQNRLFRFAKKIGLFKFI
jgi:disulfide oxidoreductase YuzD